MNRQISAQYGQTLQQAAAQAITALAREVQFEDMLRTKPRYVFDYHGLEVPMKVEMTAEDLVALVSPELAERARLYDTLPAAPDATAREQGGKMGEHLYTAIPSAVQCGQRWGNHTFERDQVEQLRHVFEFNGIKVPFNPWKEGEVARIQQEVETQMKQAGGPLRYTVHM
jgi:hypothetical protein